MEQTGDIIIDRHHVLAFKIQRCFVDALFIVLLLVVTFLAMAPTPGHAQGLEEVVLYEENFNDDQAQGWELEPGWTVDAGMLNGYGHTWARYTEGRWGDARLTFKLESNGVHVNIRNSDTGRYAIGFREKDDFLFLYLFKQLWPETFFNDLATNATRYSAGEEHQVDISTTGGRIQVTVDGMLVIDYTDPDPLPPGTIAFETLDNTFAQVDDIIVIGPPPAQAMWTLSGRIYEGEVGEESHPLQGVTVEVYGATNPYPDPGVLIASTTTDEHGWYRLEVPTGYEFYSIRKTDPPEHESVGATTVGGTVRISNWIEYVIPLEEKTLTGNKFWNKGPAPEPTPPPTQEGPDLAILSADYWFEDDGRVLVLFVEIANQGNTVAPETLVYAGDIEHDWLHEYSSVQASDPEEAIPVEIWLDIPEELRGTTRTFRVEVDPEDTVREIDEENNEAMIPVEGAPEDELPLLEVVVTLGVVGGIIFTIRKIRRRNEWQEKAKEEEPPETCQPCTRYCRKIELELEPALQKITHLSFGASDPVSGEQSKEIQGKGELVDGLNKAVMAHRRREKPEKLQEQVAPLAHALLQQIMEWLHGELSPRDIFVTGHMEGGKVTCRFILYHCKRRGTVNAWEEDAKWKATIKCERDEFVGTLRGMEPTELGIPEQVAPDLTRLLMQFIEKV
jgi:hypothetical protein